MSGNSYADRFVDQFMKGEPPEATEPVPSDKPLDQALLESQVVEALKGVYDPEIPVNIYDLGLIYDVRVDARGFVEVDMTLTAPGCPVAQTFPGTVECAVKEVCGVTGARVELVWDPPWTMDRMSEAARLELGLL